MDSIPSYWRQRAAAAVELPRPFSFDPTYGYGLEDLLEVQPVKGPEDFGAFWKETYQETRSVRPEPELREILYAEKGWRCFEIDYSSWQGFRVGGWLVVPSEGEVTSAVVFGHGYGGRLEVPRGAQPGMATLYPCARGFQRSARPDLPATSENHVLHGIESREAYLIRGCVADLWAAVTVLEERTPGVPIFYRGGSFGGGLGALALPWEPRFQRAFIGYPTFGHHPLRVTLPCTGSGEAVRRRYANAPEIMETLRYYDASTAALEITTPTFIDVGCYDPAVPPPGQFAVFNALRQQEERHRFTVHTCHHYEAPQTPGETLRTLREMLAWFGEK